ncbi:hypothetical protein CK501_13895 [Halovibrio salipaludis]|uniref:Uncharacterized protein n=1 Tax=Halovibrio salipaludis TaxID=2032626 RepID=A0A2A2F1X5_9GAMM|nr:hypothetical protein [Halovibrio salipaludis]PAU78770.1 hypothetical protein CK501_13895 [Halovibrio salipaludis]
MSEQIKLGIMAAPGFIALGVGINGIWGEPESKIHPFLENEAAGYLFLVVGGLLSFFALVKGAFLLKNKFL